MDFELNNLMKKYTLPFALLLLLLTGIQSCSTAQNHFQIPDNTQQLMVVVTDNWESQQGFLAYYEENEGKWEKQSKPIPITVGKNGLAWGKGLHPSMESYRPKKEGDGKAPAGVFALSAIFGYEKPQNGLKMPFLHAHSDLLCIDDVSSQYYNQIISQSQVQKDWKSYENMKRQDVLYRWGIVVAHNSQPSQAGSGSCIFLHIWRGSGQPTVGCTAMEEVALKKIITWLDKNKMPLLVQLPKDEYEKLKATWGLPSS